MDAGSNRTADNAAQATALRHLCRITASVSALVTLGAGLMENAVTCPSSAAKWKAVRCPARNGLIAGRP